MSEMNRHVFLANAIAGRKVSVQVSIKNDTLAFSDGQTITVPVRAQAMDQDQWMEVVAQSLLIAAGSLNVRVLRSLLARSAVAQRYAYLEVLRASRLLAHRLPLSFSLHPDLRDASPITESAEASLAIAASSQLLPALPVWFGTVRPLVALRRAVSEDGLAALASTTAQGKLNQREVRDLGEEESTESSAILRLFQNPFSSGSPLSDMLGDILGTGVSKGRRQVPSKDQDGTEMPVGRIERALRRGTRAVLAKLPFDLPDLETSAGSQALIYPEWDVHAQSYRHDWVFAEEVEPWRPDGPQDLGGILKAPEREWRRQLANLGLDHEMHRRQNDGTELDVGALIDSAIDIHAGHPPPTLNIYRASRRTRRDLAVVIVLDISGSTGEQDETGSSIFAKQLKLAYQLGYSLDALGDTVAMFGFHSWGRKLVRVIRLKGHEERWSAPVAERLALLEPVGYTRTGTAIRHGTQLLAHGMRLPHRLLVLITDGIAYDQDYEHRYAEGDTRKALEEARAAGTACVCINVGAGTETAKLVEVFGAANILAVDEVADVRPRIRSVFRQALVAVSKRRFSQENAAK